MEWEAEASGACMPNLKSTPISYSYHVMYAIPRSGVFRNAAFENPENGLGAEDNFGTAIFRNFFQPGERLPCPRDAERNGGGTCQCAAKKCLYEVKPLGKKQKHIPPPPNI